MPRFIYLQLHLLVALFAITAILGRLISLSAPALVAWRTFFAAVAGAMLLGWITRRRVIPPAGTLVRLLGVGAIVGAHWMCFFGAVKLANVSICLAGAATISFFTAFTEPVFEKRRIRPLEVILGLVALAGILLVAGFEHSHLAGLISALAGAFLAAVFPVINRRLVKNHGLDPLLMVTWEMAGASMTCLATLFVFGGIDALHELFSMRGYDLLWILLLALVCTVFAFAFHIHLLRHLSAYTGNLAMNLEPVYGIIAAAIIFGEHRELHPGFFVGISAILVANILHPLILRRLQNPKEHAS